MLFSSLTFIFGFLPSVLVSYFVIKNRKYRNFILLVFSLMFYAWGEPSYLALMLGVVLIAYISGYFLVYYKRDRKKQRFVLFISLILTFLSLFYFKYFNFFIQIINFVLNKDLTLITLAMPIGISFFTFQAASYIVDLYKGKVKLQRNYFDLTLYVSFFPQLIAGPIVQYETIEKEIKNREESLEDFIVGVKRFIIGMSKKVLISNQLALMVDTIYATDLQAVGTIGYWIATIGYTFQIYFDFSGYSDMAIGLGKMFGFNFLENFNYPYMATSVTDFWRRWHISLSSWFKEYVYIPLGGNRVTIKRHILNLLIVWLLTGFWHGANYNYIIWGIYYWILLVVEKYIISKWNINIPTLIKWLVTFFIVNIGWVIFRVEDMNQLSHVMQSLFIWSPTDFITIMFENDRIFLSMLYFIPSIVLSGPWIKNYFNEHTKKVSILLLENILLIILFIINIMFLISSTYNPFIYFRF